MGVMAAVVVAGSALAVGYFGFETLRGEFRERQMETRDAVVALKTATIAAVQSAQTATVEKLSGRASAPAGSEAASGQMAPELANELAALKTIAETIRSEQKAISENLVTLAEREAEIAKAMPAAMAMPPVESMHATSIYYPLGVAKGPQIDEQVTRIVPMLKSKTAAGKCRINVSGYSDTLGNDEKNLKLSQERADYVAVQLRGHGLAVESVTGWGERRLKVHTLDAAKNEQNRRVVVDMDCTVMPKPAPSATTPTS